MIVSKIITKIPPIRLRGLQLGQQRAIQSPKNWRKAKGNVQAVAGRSFETLKHSLIVKINKLMVDHVNYGDEIVLVSQIDKQVKAAYKKAYLLGLKASGITLYQHNLSFKKVSLPTLDAKEAYWLNQTIFEKSANLKEIVRHGTDKLLNEIESDLLLFYQYGRVVGAPIYAFVYFNCDSGAPSCKRLVDMSPWPKELVDTINPCCRFKIISKTALEYRERLLEF
jgi:hypothetical protein